MRIINVILAAATALACTLSLSCGPDTEGEPTPLAEFYIWVADEPDKEVVIFGRDGNYLKTVGGFGMFSKPNAIDVYDADGSFWVCDFYTNKIRKFTADGAPVYATPGSNQDWLVLNPTMISVGQLSGECWVADRGHNRVIRLREDGAVLAKVTGFNFPRCVSVDPNSNDVWVADEMNNAVVKISGNASGDVNVNAVEIARYEGMTRPWAVAADADGAGWATSRSTHTVVKISPKGDLIARVGGFDEPVDIAVDKEADAVYVIDAAKGILVALPRNTVGNYNNYADVATFVVSGLVDPEDVQLDADEGLIFVAEMGASKVRIYDREGTPVRAFGGVNGPAALATWKRK